MSRRNAYGAKMTLRERITDPSHDHNVFANWVVGLGVLGNFLVIVGSFLGAIILPIILINAEANPQALQKFMLFSFTWAVLGVYLRQRDTTASKVVTILIATFIAFYGYLFMFNFSNFEELSSFTVGMWLISTVFLLAIGSFTAPLRLLWKLGTRLVQKVRR